MAKDTNNGATLSTVELSTSERLELSDHLHALFSHEAETIVLLENCRDAPATAQWNCIETIVHGRGWDTAEGNERDLPSYRIYGRMILLGIELDQAMAPALHRPRQLHSIQLRVRQLFDDTIEELREQMRQAQQRVAVEWLAEWHSKYA